MYYCEKCKNWFKHDSFKVNQPDDDPYEMGRCPILGCDGRVVDVDDDLVIPIKILNDKGYETWYSCEGHPDLSCGGYYGIYIALKIQYDEFIKINKRVDDILANSYFQIIPSVIHCNEICTLINLSQKSLNAIDDFKPNDIASAYTNAMKMRLDLMRLVESIKPIDSI